MMSCMSTLYQTLKIYGLFYTSVKLEDGGLFLVQYDWQRKENLVRCGWLLSGFTCPSNLLGDGRPVFVIVAMIIQACCLACFCPCVAVGHISEILNGGTISCGYSGIVLRELFSLPPLPGSDLCLHICCSPCAISQEYRELQNRGAHLSSGWEANVEKWKQDGLMPPITVLAMVR
ncbi:hypothetical protein OROMI_010470 [Orobanche minor]